MLFGSQVCRLRVAGYGERVRGEQLEKRIVAFLLPVIESEQPLLKFRIGGLRHHGGAAARKTQQGQRKREGRSAAQ